MATSMATEPSTAKGSSHASAPAAHGSATAASRAVTGRAIVVGASSGMGAELVRQLAAKGWDVTALARRQERLDELAHEAESSPGRPGRIVARAHDVRDTGAVPALFEELVRELGGLDMIVYAAGIMTPVGLREYPTERDLELLAINVDGCVAWLNEAATFFTSQRSGRIVGISSVAGDRGRKGNPVYCTSKAAMNTYLEALRNRLAEVDVSVTTIKPGFVATRMTEDLEAGALLPIWPVEKAAKAILSAARWRASVRYVPRRWFLVMSIIRAIPSFLFRHLNV